VGVRKPAEQHSPTERCVVMLQALTLFDAHQALNFKMKN
jgi:hypothetical protein